MSNHLIFKFLYISACVTLSSLSFGDTFYITPVNRASSIESTVNALVKNEVASQGHILSETLPTDWTLASSVISLGSSQIVTLSKLKGQQTVFSEKLKARSLEDLDTVVERLVKAVLQNRPVEETQTVDTVTQEEVKGTTVKTEVTRQFYLGFGPGRVSGLKTDSTGFAWTLGYLWGLDHNISLRLGLDGNSIQNSQADMQGLGVGVQYYLNREKHAPYLAGMIAYSWAENNNPEICTLWCENYKNNGWGLEASAGFQFFRTATVNFALELSYLQGMYEVENTTPSSYSLKFIVLW